MYKKIIVVIAFVLLILPLLKINDEYESKTEKRYLAKYKPFYDKNSGKINLNYGKNFEDWLKDRFWGRLQLVRLNTTVKYSAPGRYVKINKVLADKKNGILYEKIKTDYIYDGIWNSLKEETSKFTKYCDDRNMKTYFVVIPAKHDIYPSDIVNNINLELLKAPFEIAKDNGVNISFPVDEFIKAKNESEYPLYYNTDDHPSEEGAYLGYKILMSMIQKDFPNVKIATPDDFSFYYDNKVLVEFERKHTYGSGCFTGGLPDYLCQNFHKFQYRFYKHKNFEKLKTEITDTDDIRKKTFYYPEGADLRVFVFGDSTSENLMDFLPYSFKNVLQIRINGPKNIPFDSDERYKIIKQYENEINNFNPDIMVVYIGDSFKYALFLINRTD